jgi:hypothetical protein
MKEVNSEEFENLIFEMVEGKKQIKDAVTELECGHRAFHNKVMELSITNPELYREYVIKFPYKPKQITHIDYEALLIYVIKHDLTLEQAQEEFGISRRTIDRNILKANISPDVVELYRIYARE